MKEWTLYAMDTKCIHTFLDKGYFKTKRTTINECFMHSVSLDRLGMPTVLPLYVSILFMVK